MDPQEAKRDLLKLRLRLLHQEDDLSESLAVPLEEEAGEESLDQHPADVGTATFTRELDLSLQYNTERLLAQITRALEKIDEGTYARCDQCGRPIEESRLEVVPYATLCLEHQREIERSG